jgi:hypothetical protein
MEQMKRYAVYYAPPAGAFADRAAAWLGYDVATGRAVDQPDVDGLDLAGITQAPRKYGFHGTIRAPFRAVVGREAVENAVAGLARRLAPCVCEGLALENLHGFLALTPVGDVRALRALAKAVVMETNPLRAALNAAELAKRRPESLTPRQGALLAEWGYPYVFEEFQFHLTLTDQLDSPESIAPLVAAHFAPVLPRPFVIEDLCLFGEDAAGQFHLLHRYALTG